MKPPIEFTRIVNRMKYSVKTAQLLAGDDYWDARPTFNMDDPIRARAWPGLPR